jgi:hypothetical protein
LRHLTKRGKAAFAYFGVVIGVGVVGVLIGGAVGDTIVAIAAAILALSLFVAVGIGKAAEDMHDRGRR